MEFSNTLIRVILLVIVLVVVAVPLRGFFYSDILPFFKSDFKSQTPDVQNTVQNDFNAMAANINSCMSKNDANCVCKNVIPSFPNTFYSNGILKFSWKTDTKLEYFWKGKTSEFNSTFQNALVSVIRADLTGSGAGADLLFKESPFTDINSREIVFSPKEAYPKMGDLFIVSPNLFKTNSKQAVFVAVRENSIEDAKNVMNRKKECA